MESSKKEATLNICHSPLAEKTFPNHPQGSITIVFGSKRYKVRSSILDYSHVLSNLLQTETRLDLSDVLVHARSEEALDLVMRLIVGFKDVVVPERLYVQFYLFLDELSNLCSKGFVDVWY